jgi:hypothetical protein
MSTRKLKPKAKRKAVDLDETPSHVPFHNPTVSRLEYTVTSDAGSSKTMSVIGRKSTIPSLNFAAAGTVPIVETVAPPVKKNKDPGMTLVLNQIG